MIIVSQDKWITIVDPKIFEIDYSYEVKQYKIVVDGRALGYYNSFESTKAEVDNIISSLANDESCYFMKEEMKSE